MNSTLPERNTITQAKHQHEVFRQITIPCIIGGTIFLAIAVLAGFFSSSDYQSRWADISLVWLVLPNLVVSLVCLAALGGMTYGLFRLIAVLPPVAFRIQNFFLKAQAAVRKYADLLLKPIFDAQALNARQRALRRSLSEAVKKPLK